MYVIMTDYHLLWLVVIAAAFQMSSSSWSSSLGS